jgi:hypothetical protein
MSNRIPLHRLREISRQRPIRRPESPDAAKERTNLTASTEWPIPTSDCC